jgi:hypothetical protein
MRWMACVWSGLFLLVAVGCCDQIKEDADALKARHAKCEPGDTCVIVEMYDAVGDDNCLGAFQCPTALNAADLDGFESKAKDLAGRFTHCDECAQADCAGTDGMEAFCNEETSKCDMRSVDGEADGGV